MKYSQGIRDTVVRTVPAGGVVADTAYLIGAEILVACAPYDAADAGLFLKRGGCHLAPKSGDVPADGGACYLDATTHEVQATPSSTVYLCGTRSADYPYDDGTTLIGVDLDGTTAAIYGVPGDVQGVTAGTGLIGGGTSGTVTVALSADSIASLGKAEAALPTAKVATKVVKVALGQSSGTTAGDPTWVGASKLGYSPDSGNDQEVASVVIDGLGSVVLTLAAASTAEATFQVSAILA